MSVPNTSQPNTRPDTAKRRLAIMRADFLTLATKVLSIRILDLQGLSEGWCTKSASKLAIDCGLREPSVRDALKQLRAAELLESDGADGQRARRRLRIDRIDALLAAQDAKVAQDAADHRELKRTRRAQRHVPKSGKDGHESRDPDVTAPGYDGTLVPGHHLTDARTSGTRCQDIRHQMPGHPGIPELHVEHQESTTESASARARMGPPEGSIGRRAALAFEAAVRVNGGIFQTLNDRAFPEIENLARSVAEQKGLVLDEILATWAGDFIASGEQLKPAFWKTWAVAAAAGGAKPKPRPKGLVPCAPLEAFEVGNGDTSIESFSKRGAR